MIDFYQVSGLKPGCMEVMCSTNKCMLDEELIREMEEGVDKGLYTWSPSNYSEFWGKSLEEGRLGKLGAEQANIPVKMKRQNLFKLKVKKH